MASGNIVPQKIVLKSTTKISLSDRFTNIQASPPQASTVQQVRMTNAAAQQATQKNRRLAMQMANRPTVQAALKLKKRSLKQRLGDGGVPGGAGGGGIKARLTLGGPRGGPGGRGRGGRGRGGRGGGQENFTPVQQRLGSASSRGSQMSLASRSRGGRGGQMRGIGGGQMRGTGGGQMRGTGGGRGQQRGQRGFRGQMRGTRGFRGNAVGNTNRGFGGQSKGFVRGRGSPGRGGRGQFQQRGRGRGQRGGRGRGGRGRGQGQTSHSREDLDNQLDSYMSKTKGHLDAELDAYMAQTE